jgi:RNA polymerase sigma factor (sigma-70 family)
LQADGFRDLLQKAQSGEPAAMDRLLTVIRDHLARSAEKFVDLGRSADSTSDLVQDASLRVWQRLDQFRGGATDEDTLAMFLAWSLQIVNRLGFNNRRDRTTLRRSPQRPIVRLGAAFADDSVANPQADPPANGATPSANVRSREQTDVIREAVNRLPDECDREILRLRFLEGFSLRQIAETLPLSYDQVRYRFQAIMRKLESELEGLL